MSMKRRPKRERPVQPTCRQPDRDFAKLLCGYPLPCPWHTAIIHMDKTPPTVEIPTTATNALDKESLLRDVAAALVTDG